MKNNHINSQRQGTFARSTLSQSLVRRLLWPGDVAAYLCRVAAVSFLSATPGNNLFRCASCFLERGYGVERRFPSGIDPGQATLIAAELVHDDYAYVFEAHWDLWIADRSNANWILEPGIVKFIVQGEEFDEGSYQQTGHIQVDFGLDSYFLQPETSLTEQTRAKIRDNVAKLVEFSVKVEKNSGANVRLLWSESEESLAQKLIARLQNVQ